MRIFLGVRHVVRFSRLTISRHTVSPIICFQRNLNGDAKNDKVQEMIRILKEDMKQQKKDDDEHFASVSFILFYLIFWHVFFSGS